MSLTKERIIIVVISLGVLASSMSTTMLAIAYPELITSFEIDYEILQWRNILFWSTFGVFMPFFGFMLRKGNPKKQFIIGLLLFSLSSMASALAPSWPIFLIAQTFQGLADAMIVPVQAALIRILFNEDKIGWAFGLQGAVMAVGSLSAPVIGGFIIHYYDWNFIFVFLFIIGISSLSMALKFLPDNSATKSPKLVKVLYTLPTLGTISMLLIFISAQAIFISNENLVLWVGLLLTGLVLFIYNEFFQNKIPKFIPEGLFQNVKFILTCLRGVLLFTAINALAIYTPSYFIEIHNYSPSVVGFLLMVTPLVMMSLGSWGGKKVDGSIFRSLVFGIIFMSIYAIGLAFPPFINSYVYFIVVFSIGGVGAVLALPAQNKIAITSISAEETGPYMGLFQMLQFTTAGFAGVLFAPFIENSSTSIFSTVGFQIMAIISGFLFILGLITVLMNKKSFLVHKEQKKIS